MFCHNKMNQKETKGSALAEGTRSPSLAIMSKDSVSESSRDGLMKRGSLARSPRSAIGRT